MYFTDFSEVSGSSGGGVEDSTHLNTNFLSPLARDHASEQQFTFSPPYSSAIMINLWIPPLGEREPHPSIYIKGEWRPRVSNIGANQEKQGVVVLEDTSSEKLR